MNAGDRCADLSERFPDGVFKVECLQDAASLYGLLLETLQDSPNQDTDANGTEPQNIKERMQSALEGQSCLIWLDNVQQKMQQRAAKDFLGGFRAKCFKGALLVTAVQSDIWDGLPDSQKVHIGNDTFWAAPNDSSVDEGDMIASKILASRAANDKSQTLFPSGCEVCLETWAHGHWTGSDRLFQAQKWQLSCGNKIEW